MMFVDDVCRSCDQRSSRLIMLTLVLTGWGERGDVAVIGGLVWGDVAMVKRLFSCRC